MSNHAIACHVISSYIIPRKDITWPYSIHHVPRAYATCIQHTSYPESIYNVNTAYSMSRNHVPCPYSIYHVRRAYTMSEEHISCPYSIYHVPRKYTMCQEHTYTFHRHPTRSGSQLFRFSFFLEFKDDLWDVKCHHHWYFFKGLEPIKKQWFSSCS